MSTAEFCKQGKIPYVPFSTNPEVECINSFDVLKYLSPEQMSNYIKGLSDKVKFDKFEAVLVNMNGGKFLFDQIAKLQNYQKPPILIEYHRPDGGFGAKIDIPVPEEIKGKYALVVDDIYDTGGVLRQIMSELSTNSQAVVLVTKKDIQDQIAIKNIHIGVKIDNVWIGGCGMDLGVANEQEVFRSYPGIVVNKGS